MSLVGQTAPGFSVEPAAGEPLSLSETLDCGPTVVLINRGSWCSYCAEQLQTFSELHYDVWRHQGVDIVTVLNDPLADLVAMRDRFKLTIQLYSDPSGTVAEAYTGIESDATHGPTPDSGHGHYRPRGHHPIRTRLRNAPGPNVRQLRASLDRDRLRTTISQFRIRPDRLRSMAVHARQASRE